MFQFPDVAARALESLLAFWVDSGVDTLYADEASDRTAALAAPPAGLRSTAVRATPTPDAMPVAGPIAALSAHNQDVIGDARGAAAAAPDLAALEGAIAAFDGCPLKTAGARRAVFSRGAADAAVMIVGEAPGADEDAQGAPFVGRAGQLLDRMLAAAGLEGRVFITNTVFWRPPGNRAPTLDEQAACAPFLDRAITLVKPKFLLLVGGAAAKAVLKTNDGILSLRGRWFEWRSADGSLEIPALPTLHPAFLLRQPAAKKKSWEDLLTLKERVDRAERPT